MSGPAALLEGNWLGWDGYAATQSTPSGIQLLAGSDGTRLGGPEPSQRNVVAGKGAAIEVLSNHNVLEGNWLGVHPRGSLAPEQCAGSSPSAPVCSGGLMVDGDDNLIGGETRARATWWGTRWATPFASTATGTRCRAT